MTTEQELPIGVFDSGVGGLTVLKALQEKLPNERFIYLGDTARLPYGTKTPKTVSAYALQAVNFLLDQGIKLLVVACNTATALALPTLKQHFPKLPIIGVIDASARAGLNVSHNKHIAVIATQATKNSKGYEEALLRFEPDAKVKTEATSLLVALAEEGMLDNEIARLTIEHYLNPILQDQGFQADTLILGCTHFPALRKTIEAVVGQRMQVVDSAHAVADEVKELLALMPNLVSKQKQTLTQPTKFLVTDGVGRFMQVAKIFLEQEVDANDISLVDFNF